MKSMIKSKDYKMLKTNHQSSEFDNVYGLKEYNRSNRYKTFDTQQRNSSAKSIKNSSQMCATFSIKSNSN
jgi:hypothetical protein